ncbi:MAG TPA: AAA family ATPase [Candidatus Binataceae bacterium]|nr:AAA family ATPase [Candidatus Binataceae bacterium]
MPDNARSAHSSFIGRQREMTLLSAGLAEVLTGQGRLFLIEGEPGIGKTRLANELCALAEAQGARIAWGRCWEGGGAPAYWPWIQIFRSLGETSGLEPRAAADTPAAVSSTAPKDTSLAAELFFAGSAADSKRFRLFDALNERLRQASESTALVLVLDDFHAADPASLLFLKFVSRDLRKHRAMLLVTYRAAEIRASSVLPSLFADIVRDGETIHLRGISENETERFLSADMGGSPGTLVVQQLYRVTDGNPFFLGELVRLLRSTDQMGRRRTQTLVNLKVPEGVRAIILKRLELVSLPTRNILLVASALGREFDIMLLGQVTGVDRDRIDAAVEEACRFAILDEQGHPTGRVRFLHALIPETLYSELPRHEKRRLHEKIAETIEVAFRDNLEPHLSELAHHYSLSLTEKNAPRAAEYAARAAVSAQKNLAYEEAARFYGLALGALAVSPSSDPLRRCELMLSQGSALYSCGDFDQSRSVFKQAVTIAKSLGDPFSTAVAVLGLGVAPSTPGVPDVTLVAMLEEALGALGQSDSPIRAALMGRLAEELYWSEQSSRRDELSRAAVEMARRLADKRALVDALYRRHIVLTGPDTTEERLLLSTEIIGLIRELGPSDAVLRAHYLRIADLLELGDLASADAEIEIYRQRAQELRQEHLGMIDLMLAMRALMSGRFDEGEQLALRGFEAIQRRREGFSTQVLAVQMSMVRREQGRLSELIPVVKSFTTQYPALTLARCGLAFFYAQLGEAASASYEFEYFWKTNFRTVQRNAAWLPSLVLLSDVCAFLRNREAAAELYQLLLPYAARNATLDVYVCYGSVAHYLGILAATLGNFESALAHFEAALEFNLKMNARPLAAYTQYEYANMLLARNESGDRENALSLGSAALTTAEILGMKSLVERLHTIIGRDPRAEAGPDGTVTVLFTDIVNSTGINERLGDLRAQELLHVHNGIVREALNAHRGFEVKGTGDGFMVAFPSASAALRCAIAIQRALALYRVAHPDAPIHVSIGLNTGEAIREAGDFYGRTVILASRISKQASADEILVSGTSKEIVESSGEFRFDLGRETELKGFSAARRLFAVSWRDDT